jgi:hypothetical protein
MQPGGEGATDHGINDEEPHLAQDRAADDQGRTEAAGPGSLMCR